MSSHRAGINGKQKQPGSSRKALIIDLIKQTLNNSSMDVYAALSDQTRRQIIESLCRGERSFGEIAGNFEISRPAVSQHLKVLRDADIVTVRADAQRRIYALKQDAFREVESWLAVVRACWNPALDRLETLLREEDENP